MFVCHYAHTDILERRGPFREAHINGAKNLVWSTRVDHGQAAQHSGTQHVHCAPHI